MPIKVNSKANRYHLLNFSAEVPVCGHTRSPQHKRGTELSRFHVLGLTTNLENLETKNPEEHSRRKTVIIEFYSMQRTG